MNRYKSMFSKTVHRGTGHLYTTVMGNWTVMCFLGRLAVQLLTTVKHWPVSHGVPPVFHYSDENHTHSAQFWCRYFRLVGLFFSHHLVLFTTIIVEMLE